MHWKKTIITIGATAVLLLVCSLVVTIWIPFLSSVRVVFGGAFVVLLPGFAWTYVFWREKEIDGIGRFTLSIVLSLTLVPLMVFLLNKIGIRITSASAAVEICVLTIVGFAVTWWSERHTKTSELQRSTH